MILDDGVSGTGSILAITDPNALIRGPSILSGDRLALIAGNVVEGLVPSP